MNSIVRLLCGCAAALLAPGCGDGRGGEGAVERGQPAGAIGAERAPHASLVLILVDQLRLDSADRWMAATRGLAKRGVRFEQMRSVAPWTYPSVISLFSGLYPQQHGANSNASGDRLSTISPDVPLLPRTLRAAGYHTAGFVANPFLHEWNRPVRECFDHFDASFIGNQGPTRGHGSVVWTERMYADTVNPAILAHFDARPFTCPEFTYVHYIDVHGRKEDAERWKDAPFPNTYFAAVRYMDERIRELYDYFSARYAGRFLFVVTSDHGEDRDDDTQVGDGPNWRVRKNTLHDFNVRIPFYVLPSELVEPGRVIDQPCSNVDVAPTLLAWLGLPPQGPGPGTSLLGAIHGEAYDGESRALYAQNATNGRLDESVVHAGKKFMRYRRPADGPVRLRRLFDLARDPREIRALGGDTSSLEALLDGEAGAHGLVFEARFEEIDATTRERLSELGYGGGAGDDEGE